MAKVKETVDKQARAEPGFDQEERELLESVERDEWQSVPDAREILKRHQQIAQVKLERIRKTARVNIRISEADLDKLKARAEEEGLPYQTLMASILHKYATGRLGETDSRKP